MIIGSEEKRHAPIAIGTKDKWQKKDGFYPSIGIRKRS